MLLGGISYSEGIGYWRDIRGSKGRCCSLQDLLLQASLGDRVPLLLSVSRRCAANNGGIPSITCMSVPLGGCGRNLGDASISLSSTSSLKTDLDTSKRRSRSKISQQRITWVGTERRVDPTKQLQRENK
ncbi:hypothetical protein Tco_0549189 [Tanacetum coccineum]